MKCLHGFSTFAGMRKLHLFVTITFAFGVVRANNGLASYTNAGRNSRATSPVSNIAREDEYDVRFYWLNLDIEAANSFITGNVLTTAVVVASAGLDTFSLELDPALTVDSAEVQFNGSSFQTAAVVRGSGTEVDILLPIHTHASFNELIGARLYYHGTANESTGGIPSGAGFFEGPPNYSASPPYNASTWWPCKQNLTDKADSSWFFITTDTPSIAVSNGLLVNTVNLGGGKVQYQWESHHAIDFYLISFVVGQMTGSVQYFHPTGRTDSMLVEFYNASPSNTLDILQKFTDKFGLYPFYDEKYGVAAVNLQGGMENQTIASVGDSSVITHETALQWFGDNVTCASYRDIWLNEGFARWAESLYAELSAPDSAAAQAARINICNQYENGVAADSEYGGLGWPYASIYAYNTDTVDIAALNAGEGYDLNYNKAAMMINSLRFLINNDALFFTGLQNYQSLYSGQAASTGNFMDMMENTVNFDLAQFFDQWYYGYGFPVFNVYWNQGGNELALEVIEQQSDSLQGSLFQTPLEIEVKRLFSDTTIRINILQDTTYFQIYSANTDSIVAFVVDPNQWILNGPGVTVNDTSIEVIPAAIKTVDLPSEAISIFPNPASDYLNVRSNLPFTESLQADLYNDLGQRVISQRIKPYDTISLQGLPDGVYFLQLNQLYTYKVIVTN